MHHRWTARGAVVALHAVALLALLQHRPPAADSAGERRSTRVRLILPPQPVVAPPERREASAQAAVSGRTATAAARPDASPPADAAAPEPAATATEAAPQPPPAGEPLRSSLRLSLPPGYAASTAAARNPALSDPRSNTPRRTLEDRIADATGGAAGWVEESTSEYRSQEVGALGGRRTVMRRGDTCVELFRSRIADMDPFNGNVAPRAIGMAGKPYKCR